MKVAIYSRVSTADQSTVMQLDELRAYCQRRAWTVVEEFTDEGVSGSKESRPALDRMMKAAKHRMFDAVLCWKLDRIGRSLKHLLNLLAELQAVNCAFVSYSDNLDLSTPQGRLMFQIIGAMSEFERQLVIERTKAGMQAARRRGAHIGRPRVAVDRERIRSLRGQGLSWEAVSAQTGIPRATCQRAVAVA